MYCDLMSSYVSAINEGAVPVIESAWTHICNNESQKATAEAYDVYEQAMKQTLHNKLPLPDANLKDIHRQAKEMALNVFN